jgi:hypothetical protein
LSPQEPTTATPADAPSRPVPAASGATLDWRQIALLTGGLVVLLLVAYGHVIFGGATFVLHDHLVYTLPSRAHLVDAVAHGRLAEWWTGIGLGAPFAANANHGGLYPPAYVAALFSPSLGADLVVLLHLLWLGLGGALLTARLSAGRAGALLAGGLLMTSGFANSILVNALPPITFAWTPWLAWAAVGLARASDRKSAWRGAALVALCAALQLVSGEPAGVITSFLLATFLTLVLAQRRLLAVARFAGAVAFALWLSAFAWLPAVHLLFETDRAGGLSLASAGIWSLHPLRLLELFWPRVLGSPADPTLSLARAVADSGGPGLDPSWALSFYTGAPTLVLAFLAARARAPFARALAWGSLALLLIALGTTTPIYQLFRAVFLPERLVRYPQRHFAGTLVLWTALAGVGFERLLTSETLARRPGRPFALAAAALSIPVLVAWLFSGRLASEISAWGHGLSPRLDAAGVASTMIEGGLLAVAVLLVVWLCLFLLAHRRRQLAAISVGAVILAGLLSEVWGLHPLLPRRLIDQRPLLLGPIPQGQTPRPRLYRRPGLRPEMLETDASPVAMGMHHTAWENIGARFDVDHFPGWDPAQPARLVGLWAAATRAGAGTRVLDLFGVDYAILHAKEVSDALEPVIATPRGDVVLARNRQHRPRAFVAPRWKMLESDTEVLNALFAPTIDANQVRLSAPLHGSPPSTEMDANASIQPCTMESTRPEQVLLHCRADFAGYAVLLDAYWPGWSATVDGQPAPIERADALVRAVPVPAGDHRIEMTFRTPGLRPGFWLALPAWVLLVGAFVVMRRRRSE